MDKKKNNERYIKQKNKQRDKKLRRKYGITLIEYKEMLLEQKSKCAICGMTSKENKKDLAVDHNHKTGQVRQLLCGTCNTAIGFVKENPAIAREIANYIERHNGG